jgi:hypothetical protein
MTAGSLRREYGYFSFALATAQLTTRLNAQLAPAEKSPAFAAACRGGQAGFAFIS